MHYNVVNNYYGHGYDARVARIYYHLLVHALSAHAGCNGSDESTHAAVKCHNLEIGQDIPYTL